MSLKQNKLNAEHFHLICQMVIANKDDGSEKNLDDKVSKKEILSFILNKKIIQKLWHINLEH